MEQYLPAFDTEEINIYEIENQIKNQENLTNEIKNEIIEYILDNLYKYTNLKRFICSNYRFKSSKLPELPNSLIELYCSRCNLKELPKNLPISLENIYCSLNRITKLPKELPNGLILLDCSNNFLKNLPKLPNSLKNLDCCNNSLKELPKILPDTLFSLLCINNYLNDLDNFPDLPDTLTTLLCSIQTYSFSTQDEINTIRNTQSKNRNFKRLNLLNKNLLLEHSAMITMNPKRIERLLESGEISFFDDSFSSLTS